MKVFLEEINMVTVLLIQNADVFEILSDTLKEWLMKVNGKHRSMNRVSRQFYKTVVSVQC